MFVIPIIVLVLRSFWKFNERGRSPVWRISMMHGFIKAAAVTPRIKVADTEYNARAVCE